MKTRIALVSTFGLVGFGLAVAPAQAALVGNSLTVNAITHNALDKALPSGGQVESGAQLKALNGVEIESVVLPVSGVR